MSQNARCESIPLVIIADFEKTPLIQNKLFFGRGQIDKRKLAMTSAE